VALSTYDRQFRDLVERIGDVPWMTPTQGRRIWDHFLGARPLMALDIGTCYGTSAAYMAGAMRAIGEGRVVTVDSAQFDDRSEAKQWCEVLWERCGVRDLIETIRIPHSSYVWWLMEQVAGRSDKRGNCEPVYDFVYLDGAKSLTVDTAAVIFVEQLLRPGGWLLVDDLDWRHEDHPALIPTVQYPDDVSYRFSSAEIAMPHLRAVFDMVVKRHPSFGNFVEQDGAWGWAQKVSGDRKVVIIEEASLSSRLRRAIRVLRRRASSPSR